MWLKSVEWREIVLPWKITRGHVQSVALDVAITNYLPFFAFKYKNKI